MGQEKRGNEEGVSGKLDDTKLAVLTQPTEPEPSLFESLVISRVDAVVASIVLESRFGTVECGSPRTRNDRHRLLYPNQGAAERGDDEVLGLWVCPGMIGILEPEDVARELDDRVLKAASGADERHPSFAREADRSVHTRDAPVRTACGRDQETGVPGQTLLGSLGRHLATGYPLRAKTELRERPVRGVMNFVPSIKVADDPDSRNFHVDGASVTPPRSYSLVGISNMDQVLFVLAERNHALPMTPLWPLDRAVESIQARPARTSGREPASGHSPRSSRSRRFSAVMRSFICSARRGVLARVRLVFAGCLTTAVGLA